MKIYASLALAFTLALCQSTLAQPGSPSAPGFGMIMTKLVGDNKAFTADVLLTETARDQATTIPGKIAFNAGRLRVDINLGEAKSPRMKPENIARLKTMGVDKTVDISLPDKKIAYFFCPNLSAYVETPLQNADLKPEASFKLKTTELGKETIDGHPCIKNKAVITDDQGGSYESTVWNATDLKKLPIKIEVVKPDQTTTYAFSNVKFGKPDAALFELPANYKKYASKQSITFEQMKKQMQALAPATNQVPSTNHP